MPNDKTPTTLKPCPLCAGVAILFPASPCVQCVECGCEVWGESVEDAIRKWQRRDS